MTTSAHTSPPHRAERPTASAQTASSPRVSSPGALIGVILVASFMDLLDVTIVAVAAPDIQRSLGASPAQLQWMIAAYALALGAALITGGRLGDEYGRRRVFLMNGGRLTLSGMKGATLSVFPFGCASCEVTYSGLKYPLEGATLSSEIPLGVSNEFIGAPSIVSVKNGLLAVMWSYEAFSFETLLGY